MVVGEIRSLWSDGLLEYVSDLWNIVDFIQNMFYVIWIMLRVTAWIVVQVNILLLIIIYHISKKCRKNQTLIDDVTSKFYIMLFRRGNTGVA